MKTADELFEELGYKKLQPIGLQQCAYTNGRGKEIIINQYKRIGLYGNYQWVTLEELKAINEKCKEMGWLDEK